MRKIVLLVRAALAAAAVAGVAIGVPVMLLAFVGNPLPGGNGSFLGGLSAVVRVSQMGLSDTAVVRLLAGIVWVAWLRLTLALVVEIAAGSRGRMALRVPMLGSSQDLAARLLSPILLLGASFGSGSAAFAGTAHHPAAHASMAVTAPVVTSARVTVEAGGTWVVQRNDSFWGIAEAMLGDGSLWRDVVSVNIGHEVAPGIVFSATTEVIHPGWTLRVPRVAGTPITDDSAPVDANEMRVVVRPGDTLSSMARNAYGDEAAWRVIWDANRDQVGDPNVVLPGWKLVIPDDLEPLDGARLHVVEARLDVDPTGTDTALRAGGKAPSDTVVEAMASQPANRPAAESSTASSPIAETIAEPIEVTDLAADRVADPVGSGAIRVEPREHEALATAKPAAAPTSPSGSASKAPQSASAAVARENESRSVLAGLAAPASGLLLSAGAVSLLDARRRHRLRQAPCHARMPLPARHVADMESRLREVASGERLARVDLAIRRSADVLAPSGGRVMAVVAGVDGTIDIHIEFVETRTVSAGDGVTHHATMRAPTPLVALSATCWRLPASVATSSLGIAAQFAAFPCPALVHIGIAEHGDVFVDLEALGLLVIDGPSEAANDIVRALITGLALSPFADGVRIVSAGDHATNIPRVLAVDDADAAIDAAAGWISGILGSLKQGDTTFALRHRSAGEAWEPTVVVLTHDSAKALGGELIALTTPPARGLGILSATAAAESTWAIRLGDDGVWTLDDPSGVRGDFGIAIRPLGLSRIDQATVAELIDPPEADPQVGPAPRRELAVAFDDPHWELLVRVLGPVDVIDHAGTAAEFEKSKSLELVSWLADRSTTPTRGAARAALWSTIVRDGTFANVVSEARRALAALATPPAGEEWIGRTLTELLPLHPLVTSDAALLEARLDAARRCADPVAAVAILRPGLDLVRGAPFEASTYHWPDAEGRSVGLSMMVVSASTELASRLLDLGDYDDVFTVTDVGLRLISGYEELISLRMRAHGARGDFAGVRAEFEQYQRILDADDWSDGEPSPKLVELRRELMSPSAKYKKAS